MRVEDRRYDIGSIGDTKELIARCQPDDEISVVGKRTFGEFVQGISTKVANIQAVFNNHTRLLTAAKKYLALGEHGSVEDAEKVAKELRDAIAEGEAEA